MSKNWAVVLGEHNELHITPINDRREHSNASTCWCQPTLEAGAGDMLWIHNAMDRREAFEEGK